MKPSLLLLLIIGALLGLPLISGVSVGHSVIYVTILLILTLPLLAIALLISWALRRRRSG